MAGCYPATLIAKLTLVSVGILLKMDGQYLFFLREIRSHGIEYRKFKRGVILHILFIKIDKQEFYFLLILAALTIYKLVPS